jgi:DNA-binding response OmpR family regulator
MNPNSHPNGRTGDLFLLVGENPVFLQITELFLARNGASNSVYTSTKQEEAVGVARALKPAVVLIDLDMPDKNSVGLIQNMREITPDSVIIALTLLESNAYRQMVLSAGADDFISKAQLSAQLMPRIAEAVKSRNPG